MRHTTHNFALYEEDNLMLNDIVAAWSTEEREPVSRSNVLRRLIRQEHDRVVGKDIEDYVDGK